MTASPPTVRSVNVGRPREVTWLRRTMRTSIGKHSLAGPVEVLDDGLAVFAMYVGDRVDVEAVLAVPGLAAHWQDWRGHRTVWHLDEEEKRAAEDAQLRTTP